MEGKGIEELDDMFPPGMSEPTTVLVLDDSEKCNFVDGGLGIFVRRLDDLERNVLIPAILSKTKEKACNCQPLVFFP